MVTPHKWWKLEMFIQMSENSMQSHKKLSMKASKFVDQAHLSEKLALHASKRQIFITFLGGKIIDFRILQINLLFFLGQLLKKTDSSYVISSLDTALEN